MSKTMILVIAGILFGWLGISLFTKSFDGGLLITLLIGVFIGYSVKKKETAE